jgi:hypothetical protein
MVVMVVAVVVVTNILCGLQALSSMQNRMTRRAQAAVVTPRLEQTHFTFFSGCGGGGSVRWYCGNDIMVAVLMVERNH